MRCSRPGCMCNAELPKAVQPYTAIPVLHRLPGERVPAWTCACRVKRPHTEAQHCLAPSVVTAWQTRHPEATCSEKTARALAWMAQEFGGGLK